MRIRDMRHAIAMIELIFAIVIMGFVLMSAPMLIGMTTKSAYVAMQQEAINEAASQINMILSYHWDENDTNGSYYEPLLQTTNGDSDLNEDGSTGKRIGTPKESYRKFVTSNGQRLDASSTLGSETSDTEYDDVDDFNGETTLIAEDNTSSDYTETKITQTITYLADSPTATTGSYRDPGDTTISFSPDFSTTPTGTTNIKKIKVTLTSDSGASELSKEITMYAFSCNIGSYVLEER